MAGRIILFGATGYTGRLTAEAMVGRGERPVIAGRDSERLVELAGALGLESVVADVARPETVRAMVETGDVLVTTVGPFARWGDAALQAASAAGAAYLDSNGEPAFIRRVFERYPPGSVGAGLVTAFGYDSIPGNLAASLALREAGEGAERVDIGYFMPGDRRGWMSGGTRASLAAASLEPAFAWRSGIKNERPAARVRSFLVAGNRRHAISAGSSEHFALPRLHPRLHEVNTYLGYLVRFPRAAQLLSALGAGAARVAGMRAAVQTLASRLPNGAAAGPDAKTRAKTTSHVVAATYDASGARLSEVHLSGINGYEFTARILAWGASAAAAGRITGGGALGPVDAFGLDELEAGCADAGMQRVRTPTPRETVTPA